MNERELIEALNTTRAGDADHLVSLRNKLVADAVDGDLLDVSYRTMDSPIGRLLVAATQPGLLYVAFENEGHESVLQEISVKVSPRVFELPERLDDVARQIDEYFDGKRKKFELHIDLSMTSGFRREVVEHLANIEYGTTASYAALAEMSGRPKAVRAAGTACATNPLPIVIPCHRVVRSDGKIGNYRGGTPAKEYLLAMEAGD